ncbi:DNA cytosine methyltransferase [Opitutaceae bacterium TAV3]|nr:DNA cytosine methyltransferase [Opitutaceae bacterium TAV3]
MPASTRTTSTAQRRTSATLPDLNFTTSHCGCSATNSSPIRRLGSHDMDTSTTVNHLSVCSGYGGIDLGLRRVVRGLRTVAACEIEAFAVANLVAKMEAGFLDAAPVWPDVKTFPWSSFRGAVDILSGGYPCQPFSAAGKRRGKDDPRHLWPHIARGVRLCQPSVCFFENVEGHITLGLRDVLHDLGELGYRATWGIFSAAEIGAPHQRKRVFILAHRVGSGLERLARHVIDGDEPGRDDAQPHGPTGEGGVCTAWPARPGERQHWWEPPRVLADTGRDERRQDQSGRKPEGRTAIVGNGQDVADRDDGCEHRADREIRSGRDATDGSRQDVADAQHLPGGAEQLDEPGERCASESQHDAMPRGGGEAVGDAEGADSQWPGQLPEQAGGGEPANAGGVMAYTGSEHGGRRIARSGRRDRSPVDASTGNAQLLGDAEPPMGGDADGRPHRLDVPKLHVTTDNRTDELRLLGNGVVPDTAARAFVTLWRELMP